MNRIAGGLALAAGILALAPAALATDGGEPKTDVERRLEEVLAELEAQRLEIDALKARLAVTTPSALAAEVAKYLAVEDEAKKDPLEFRAIWKDGLNFETADRNFTLKVGGLVQYDFVFPDADDEVEARAGDFDALSGFRRLRLGMEGTINGNVYFVNTIDFADTAYAYRGNYVGVKGLPVVGNFQVGYFKEPVGLEELTSSKVTTFTERSIVDGSFVPAFSHGAMIFNNYEDGRFTWALADMWDGGTGVSRVEHGFSARVTGVPWMDKEASSLLHLGLSAQVRSPDAETDRFRARPGTPFTPRTLDTGTVSADSERIQGLEAAFVRGPFSVQSEYYAASIAGHPDVAGAPDPDFHGWYASASWFLTGESRPYRNGTFGRIKPKSGFDTKGNGSGAWEVALRYASVDLDDDGVQGGVAHDITLGLNWYLNPSTRIMLDYVTHSVRWDADTDGKVNSLVLRFAVDF